jgi:hypothetical protein
LKEGTCPRKLEHRRQRRWRSDVGFTTQEAEALAQRLGVCFIFVFVPPERTHAK